VTTRANVHYIVTEYGIAYLHGRSIRERALSLIEIAHPRFRDRLLEEAKRLQYVYADQRPMAKVEYPARYERTETYDGGLTKVLFRPVRVLDEKHIQQLFHSLSDQSRYYRFFVAMQALPHREAQKFATVDYRDDMGIVAVLQPDREGAEAKIIASGQFMVDRRTNTAEVAFMVAEGVQNKGIGTTLLRHLTAIARENGLRGFTAEVLGANKAMMRVFLKSGFPVQFALEEGTYSVHMDLSGSPGRPDPVPAPEKT
jgi:RimJ/RimL family protein N-acetyltransferase